MTQQPDLSNLLQVETPAYVIDEAVVQSQLRTLLALTQPAAVRVLFPLKTACWWDLLSMIAPSVDGFAASSLFESKLARSIVGSEGLVHFTTPGLRPGDIQELATLCNVVSFNSIEQLERFSALFLPRVECGLRLNPEEPLVRDDRYNPCRPHSKLGTPISKIGTTLNFSPHLQERIDGLHFHTNCEGRDFGDLLKTVKKIESLLPDLLKSIQWVNLGGGYLFDEARHIESFWRAAEILQSEHHCSVFFEPGAGLVRKTASLVTTVVDLFQTEGKTVAILDTTVNHWPEVFEYQFEPDVISHSDSGRYQYILAGGSCLAGDLFGEYAFDERLDVGSRIVFANAGAYSLVKAHMFNGINLPLIYVLTKDGKLEMKRRFTYDDFANRCGVKTRATV